MRTSKVKPKRKFVYKPSVIEASFKRKNQLDKQSHNYHLHNQLYYNPYSGFWIGSCGYRCMIPISFISKNSHKQTNKKKFKN